MPNNISDILQELGTFYNDTYQSEYLLASQHLRDTEVIEREAQKKTIKITALHFFSEYPQVDKKDIWNTVYSLHVSRKSGVDISPAVIEKVKSADQSWIKSGGHAFEEIVKELAGKAVIADGMSVLLQRDITQLIHNHELANEQRDYDWLAGEIDSSAFDLFIVKNNSVFGCIQSKTSIRDRVTRDREPSTIAMERFFWSTVFVLDGDFLRLPKFKHMVNGGGSGFANNGWHGLYAFSLPENVEGDRIYQLDNELNIFKNHAVRAYEEWSQRRQWFNASWRI